MMAPFIGKFIIRRACALVWVLALGSGAFAAEFTPDPVDLAAAQREGKVSWYTSTAVDVAQVIATSFQQQTGIRVQLFRSGGSALLNRFLAEEAAGQVAVDVLTMSDAAAARALAGRGLFRAFKPVGFDKVLDAAKDPQGMFIAQRLNLICLNVRSDKVPEADWPHAWSDLRQPKFKGMMVMPDPSFTALQLTVVGTLSRTLGWEFYEDLQINGTMIVQGNQQVHETLKRGERLVAAMAVDPRGWTKQPVNLVNIYPAKQAILVITPSAIPTAAPSPNAAKLFAQFLISPEMQRLMPAGGVHSSRIDVPPPTGAPSLDSVELLPIDYEYIEAHAAEIKERFNDIFQ